MLQPKEADRRFVDGIFRQRSVVGDSQSTGKQLLPELVLHLFQLAPKRLPALAGRRCFSTRHLEDVSC